jgi:hypothetical protein
VFVLGETYVPFDWDASDLVDKARWYLDNEAERLRIVRNAAIRYREHLDALPARFTAILEEICK